MDREPRARGFLHLRVAIDVVGMAVRVEDLDEFRALLAQRVDDEALAHRRIDDDRLVPVVDDEVAAVVVGRHTPGEDAQHGASIV